VEQDLRGARKTSGFTVFLIANCLWLLGLWGCSRSAESIGARGTKAFASAPAETKALWEKALSAVSSSDYATALISLKKIKEQSGLTPDQTEAVGRTATAINDQMYEAANKGDEKAKQALQDLRKAMGR
jgi:hypothetical protein